MAYTLKAKSLITNPNELSRSEGSLDVADNVVIDRDNIIEPRRGFAEYGNDLGLTTDRAKQLLIYKDRILRHYGNKISFDSDGAGAFLDFDGTYSELEANLRIKGLEANSNFYFTTSEGIKKLSASSASQFTTAAGYVVDAGGVKAVDLDAVITPTIGGFLPPQSKVAYRVVWGIKDVNNNLILGSPSARFVLENPNVDVSSPERFSITVDDHATIEDGGYILFNSANVAFFMWFDKKDSATQPTTAETVGRTAVKADVSSATSDAETADIIGNRISELSGFSVEVSSNVVTVTLEDSGENVEDASEQSNGTVGLTVTVLEQGNIIEGSNANAKLTFTIPSDVNSLDYFYQVYRTRVSSVVAGLDFNDIDPGEEMNLVFESGITQDEIDEGEVIVDDIQPESFRDSGAPLYTNPVTGDGILQANEKPPIAHDIALFRNSAFYSNTKTIHRTTINLLSVTDFTSGVSTFIIGNEDIVREYTFVGATQVQRINTVADVAGSDDSLDGKYFLLNSVRNYRKYYVWFSTGAGAPDPAISGRVAAISGRVGVKIEISSSASADDVASALSTGLDSLDDFSTSVSTNEVTITWSRNGNVENAVDGTTGFTFGATQVQRVDTVDDVNNSLDGKYFLLNSKYYVWFSTGDGAPDPAISGRTGVKIEITTGDSADNVASALSTGLDNLDDFSTSVSTNQVTITWLTDGNLEYAVDGTTNFTFNAPSINGDGEDTSRQEVLLSSYISASQSIDETARSLVKVINRDSSSPFNAFYDSGANDLPGIIRIENKDLSDKPFYITTSDANIVSKFDPSLSSTNSIFDAGETVISAANPTQITSTAHGLADGNEIFIYNTDSTPTLFGKYAITYIDANTFSVPVEVDVAGTAGTWFLTDTSSDNEVAPNRLYYSKTNQPEAVPLLNYIEIGPKDEPINRIIAIRDNLLVLKTDGVYIVTGTSAPDFSSRLLDRSVQIQAPDTAAILNNQIYALSTQGVVTITEGGVSVISRPIENRILDITNDRFNYKGISFGLSSESDRAYHLWMPSQTSDTVPTQCYRYNTFTRAWTRWTKPSTCGIVDVVQDRIYLGSGTRNFVEKERKDRTRQDYSDRDLALTINPIGVSGKTITLSSVTELNKGDAILQEQYVSLSVIRALLKKLDIDRGMDDTDYFASLEPANGDDVASILNNLNAKLVADDDSGIVTSRFFSGSFETIRDSFNAMIGELNDPSCDTGFKNYREANTVIPYEVLIIGLNRFLNTVEVNEEVPFIEGAITAFKKYDISIVYSAQHFGQPQMTKQVNEASIIFDQNNFYSATLGFSTDLSPNFDRQEFNGKGRGDWGDPIYGENNWGGFGDETPFRTTIPREKQRCRYIRMQFQHSNARETWAINGISFNPRMVSSRGYR